MFLYEKIPNLLVNAAQYVYVEVILFVYRMCVRTASEMIQWVIALPTKASWPEFRPQNPCKV